MDAHEARGQGRLDVQAGTVTTALVTFSPRNDSAVSFILLRTMAEISSGVLVVLIRREVKWREIVLETHKLAEVAAVFDLNCRVSISRGYLKRPTLS